MHYDLYKVQCVSCQCFFNKLIGIILEKFGATQTKQYVHAQRIRRISSSTFGINLINVNVIPIDYNLHMANVCVCVYLMILNEIYMC